MFLEIRFGVLSARYLPGQVIAKADVAEVYAGRPAAVAEVLGALTHEGYLTRRGVRQLRMAAVEKLALQRGQCFSDLDGGEGHST